MDASSRAAVYTFGLPELKSVFPAIDYPNELFEEDNEFAELLQADLENRGVTLQKGDIVWLSTYDNDEFRDNAGKLIFDGEKLMELNDEAYDEFLSQFEVLTEFPIHYWEGLFNQNVVYYNFRSHQQEIDPSQVVTEGPYFYYPVTHHGITYQIISDFNPEEETETLTADGFLRELKSSSLFDTEPTYAKLENLPESLYPSPTNLYLPFRGLNMLDLSPWIEADNQDDE